MSDVDLMLLGTLMEKPMNAYGIKKRMESRNVFSWVKISAPAVYKNIVALYQKGYLDGETVRSGEMPEKTVYTVNEKGRAYFLYLMEQSSQNPGAVYIEFLPFVANLPFVDPQTGLLLIRTLQGKLDQRRAFIKANIEDKKEFVPFQAISMLELYDKMYSLFSEWAGQLYCEYAQKYGGDEDISVR